MQTYNNDAMQENQNEQKVPEGIVHFTSGRLDGLGLKWEYSLIRCKWDIHLAGKDSLGKFCSLHPFVLLSTCFHIG